MVDCALTGLVETIGCELRVMVGVDGAGAVEVIVVDNSDLWVSKVTDKVLEGSLLDPRGALGARRSGHVDDVRLVARLLQNRAALLVHGFKEWCHLGCGVLAG